MEQEPKKWIFPILVAITILSLVSFAFPTPVLAEGGIAISGSFYRQHFQLIPGESISNPDINIVVFNNYEETINVKLTTETPPGVTIDFTQAEFVIPPDSNITVMVGVSVGMEVVPGDYKILVSASVVPKPGSGIAIASAAELQADLTVFGEAGSVRITTETPDGEPFVAELHLSRKNEEQLSPAGFSASGILESRLVPGDYMVQGFYQDTKVATAEFSITANEHKDITLTAQTVFLYGFSVVPVYNENSGELSYANIVYTFTNIYVPLKDFKATLDISLDGEPLETTVVITIPTLDVGETSGTYKYIPPQGWQLGSYMFTMSVFSLGNLYGRSAEKIIENVSTVGFNWVLIVIIAAVALIGLFLFFYVRKRRKDIRKKPAQKKPVILRKETPQQSTEVPAQQPSIPVEELQTTVPTTIQPIEQLSGKEDAEPQEFESAFFSKIDLEPMRELATGELTEVKINYVIVNPKAGLTDVRIELKVSKNNTPSDHLNILEMGTLATGKGSSSYTYIPHDGWQKEAEYSFWLSLYCENNLVNVSPAKIIKA